MDFAALSLTQIVNEYPPFLLPPLKQKTAVCSIWKSGSDLVLSYLIPTGFYVFHKWLKKSSQLEIAIKSSINSWLAPASVSSLDSHSAQSRGLGRLAGQDEKRARLLPTRKSRGQRLLLGSSGNQTRRSLSFQHQSLFWPLYLPLCLSTCSSPLIRGGDPL